MFRPPARRYDFSGPSNTTSSPRRFHEAEFETAEPNPSQYLSSPSCSSPFEADDELGCLQHHTGSACRMRDDDAQCPTYHHGKMWESSTLQEQHDTSAWTTTSSSEWTINHLHRDPAELNLQYRPPPPVQNVAPTSGPGNSYDIPRLVEDVEAAPDLRLRVPPTLVPPDEIEQFFESTALRSPQTTLPVPPRPKPKYLPAHQPVPPENRSSYSELSANLEFLQKLKQEELDRSRRPLSSHRLTITIPRPTATATAASSISPGSSYTPSPLKKRKRSKRVLPSSGQLSGASKVSAARTSRGHSPSDTAFQETSIGSSTSSKTSKEPRKTSLACIFCRERKISCGRPPPGSPDPTCNQCARRSFKCAYMNEQSGRQLASSRRR